VNTLLTVKTKVRIVKAKVIRLSAPFRVHYLVSKNVCIPRAKAEECGYLIYDAREQNGNGSYVDKKEILWLKKFLRSNNVDFTYDKHLEYWFISKENDEIYLIALWLLQNKALRKALVSDPCDIETTKKLANIMNISNDIG
jgi:hypothetical protein